MERLRLFSTNYSYNLSFSQIENYICKFCLDFNILPQGIYWVPLFYCIERFGLKLIIV